MDRRLGLARPRDGDRGQDIGRSLGENLSVSTGKVLPDREMDAPVVAEIREVIAACALSVLTSDRGMTASHVREQLASR